MSNAAARIRRTGVFTGKLCLAALLVGWLWKSGRLDLSVVRGLDVDGRTAGWVTAGVAAVFGGQMLLAIRLRMLLAKQQLSVSFSRALGLTMIGAFFGSILPGLVSGDAVKAVYLFGDAGGSRGRAVAAVLLDRIVGLFSLFLLGALAMGVALLTGWLPEGMPLPWVAPAVVAAMGAGLAILSWPGWSERLPEKLSDLVTGVGGFLRAPRLLAGAVGLSVANHALVIVTFLAAGVLLRDSIPGHTHFLADPLAMVLNVIPLTPGGIGITEGALSFLFEELGSPNGAAVGLLGRGIQYVAYVTGGSVALLVVRFRLKGDPYRRDHEDEAAPSSESEG